MFMPGQGAAGTAMIYKYSVLVLALGFSVAVAPVRSQAGLYAYIDDSGVTHFTNRSIGDGHSIGNQNSHGAVRTNTARVAQRTAVRTASLEALIDEAADYYSLPAALVKAVVAAESNFNAMAVSPAGAAGLMQLRPQTASAMSVSNSFDPRENIFGGTRYLRFMLNRFQGDIALAAAAYNAGPSAVEKAHGIPPFKETRDYVSRVLRLYQIYRDR